MQLIQYYSPDDSKNSDYLSLKAHLAKKEADRRQKRNQFVKRAKKTPLHHAMLNAFSCWNYGVTDGDKRRNAYKAMTVVGRFNTGSRSKTLCAADLENHWKKLTTFYFMGNGDPRQDRILIMLDFDAKDGVGSHQGCVQAEQYIAAKYFKGNVFCEDSTSGSGRHGYVWIYKLGRKAEEVNAAIDRLQETIRADLKSINADISGFDIQGTCPVIEWEQVGGKLLMTKFTSGRLAKIPRTANMTLLDACEVTLDEVNRLASLPISVAAPLPTITRVWTEKEPNRQVCYGGSLSDEGFEDQSALGKLYKRLIAQFNGGNLVKANKRYVVQVEHAAVAFAVLRFIYDNPHKDGTLPQKRAESLWNDAYSRGLIDCSWNHYRWIAIRNFLTKCGFIEWEDNTYFHHFGELQKGRACKWSVTSGFYWMLSECRDASDVSQGGDLGIQQIARGTGKPLYPIFFKPGYGQIHPNVLTRVAEMEKFMFAA